MAQPGFINFTLSENWLKNILVDIRKYSDDYGAGDLLKNKKIIVEYTDPNPFKVFHIGHLMTNCIGESLARIFEFQNANVKRANYQSDVGIHVSKSIWGLEKNLKKDKISIEDLSELDLNARIEYLGESYELGSKNYIEGTVAKKEIDELNTLVYIAAQNYLIESEGWKPVIDYKEYLKKGYSNKEIQDMYDLGRQWSLDYFETLYKRLGTKFDYYYFESKVGEFGYQMVQKGLDKKVFEKNQGAVIFKGEQWGLHTRVFVNSAGLPVYEAKDLGLAVVKNEDFKYDKSYIITANEINEYFKVVLKALSMLEPKLAENTVHLDHGMMKFKRGKMSSRTGDVIAGDVLLNDVKKEVFAKMQSSDITYDREENRDFIADRIAVSSIKYSVLKNNIGSDIVYDQKESTSLQGNTGPYLLYTFARTNSVLKKAGIEVKELLDFNEIDPNKWELAILRHLYKFPEFAEIAAQRQSPNVVANYVFDLAQKFNAFYSEVPILKAKNDVERSFRLFITYSVGQVLKNGLNLLGIEIMDKM